jgi:Transposase DDE domain
MKTELIADRWPGLLSRVSNRIDLAGSAHRRGAFRQGRGVPDAETLLRLALAYGACGLSLRETCAWAEEAGLARLSNPALTKRLQHCPAWLAEIAAVLLAPAAARLANRPVRRVRLLDATTLCHPGATAASWRLHLAFDLAAGRVEQLTVSDGRGGERLDRFAPERGVLDIADAAYAAAARIRERLAAGGELLVRLDWRGARLFEPAGGGRFDLFAALRGLPGPDGEWPVRVDDGQPGEPLLMRLVACRKPPAACAQSRRRVQKRARQKKQTVDARTLEAADYVLLLTSLPAAVFPTAAVLDLYRLRWQIELAFKRWKSLLALGDLPAKTPDLAMTWILAKLIAVLLVDDEVAALRELFPPEPDGDDATAVPLELLSAPLAPAQGRHPHRRRPANMVAH